MCDQVDSYQVVLADGEIVNANSTANPDLWWALKGGSSNFGIVAKFNLKTFPQGNLWGGMNVHPIESRQENIDAFVTTNAVSERDEYASVICNFYYTQESKLWGISNNLVYTKAEHYPSALEPFTRIEPSYYNSLRSKSRLMKNFCLAKVRRSC